MDIITQLMADRMAAKPYEDSGYTVTIEPPNSAIPSVFGGYRPNVLAVKGDDHIMLDVKHAGSRDADLYLRVGRIVEEQPGWRLMITSFTAEDLHDDARARRVEGGPEVLQGYLQKMSPLLLNPVTVEYAFPRLWLVYIGALRWLSFNQDLSVDQLNDLSCLNQAYELGLLTWEEYEDARKMLVVRNRIVTALDATATLAECELLQRLTVQLLDQLTVGDAAGVK